MTDEVRTEAGAPAATDDTLSVVHPGRDAATWGMIHRAVPAISQRRDARFEGR